MTTRYEYKVVPAPPRGEKIKGVKGAEARFAMTIEALMNDQAADGWEYLRADTLPSEERHGLTNTTTTFRNLLVFRRPHPGDPTPFRPKLLESDSADEPAPSEADEDAPQPPDKGA